MEQPLSCFQTKTIPPSKSCRQQPAPKTATNQIRRRMLPTNRKTSGEPSPAKSRISWDTSASGIEPKASRPQKRWKVFPQFWTYKPIIKWSDLFPSSSQHDLSSSNLCLSISQLRLWLIWLVSKPVLSFLCALPEYWHNMISVGCIISILSYILELQAI